MLNTDKVLKEAYANRSDAIAFVRRIAEAKRDVAKAKGDNGLNATLNRKLGYSKSAATISKVYRSPQDQQLLQLNLIFRFWIGEDQNQEQKQRGKPEIRICSRTGQAKFNRNCTR